jgi:DNA-3-methyladenine glycosylase II
MRSGTSGPAPSSLSQVLTIAPHAPFRLDLTVWALRRRAHNAIDRWEDPTYERTLAAHGEAATLSVTQRGSREAPRLSVSLAGARPDRSAGALACDAANILLGLDTDVSAFASAVAEDPVLGPLAIRLRGLRPPRFPTAFEALVNGVACQQLSLSVGIHLLNRLTAAHGLSVGDDPAAARAFPEPEQIAVLEPRDLRLHGFSMAKARTVVEVARAIVDGDVDLEGLCRLDDATAVEHLTSLRGVGRWTAEYVLLRGLGRLHVFPGDDVGAHNKLRRLFGIDAPLDYESVRRLVARWDPFAGLVYFHLLLDALFQEGLVAQERQGT